MSALMTSNLTTMTMFAVACAAPMTGGNIVGSGGASSPPPAGTEARPDRPVPDACAGQAAGCVALALLSPTWAAVATPAWPPLEPLALGDVNADGHADWRLGEWLALGPASTVRSFPESAA